MILPTNIERRDDGALVIKGHRIKLHTVLRELARQATIAELEDQFATLSKCDLQIIASYYQDHRDAADFYLAEGEQAEELASRKVTKIVDLEALRARHAAKMANGN